MINYLLESSVCFAAFYGLYWLVLSKTKLLNLNRLYLLAMAVLSLIIPLIKLPVSQTAPPLYAQVVTGTEAVTAYVSSSTSSLPLNPWLILYLIGLLIFAFLFIKSLLSLLKLFKNPKQKVEGYWHVQTQEKDISSFLNAVFLPTDFDKSTTEGQLGLAHEKVHLRHGHSLDIILLELIRLAFWFNPFVHAYKRALKLQHEYIADHLVAQQTGKALYSQTLIRHTLQGVSIPLIHSYREHPVEKRLEMIDKQNPTTMNKLKSLIALPLIASLIFFLGMPDAVQAQSSVEEVKERLISDKKKANDGEVVKTISGKVHADKTGQALDRVTVFAVPSLSGSFTNAEGKFLIAPEETDTLIVFRKKGFDDIKVPRKRYTVINVALSEASLAKRKKGN